MWDQDIFMMEKTLWHPVALAEEVVQAPLAVRLLEQDLVLWRDLQGQVRAFVDRCPHRGARLSLGRVHADRLECPYHGWQFTSDGHCAQVPAVPDFVPPPAHCVRSFATQQAYGLVWVQLEAADTALPKFAPEGDDHLRKLNCGPYEVAASAPRIVENFLDMAHFGFVHEGWLGSRDAAVIEHYMVENTPNGIKATNCKVRQPQARLHATAAAQVHYSYEVTDPYTAMLTKLPEPGGGSWSESVGLFICPVTPETSRVWFRLAVADFASPDEQFQAFQHQIFTQDQPVLESQQPKCLPLELRAELHCAADRMSSAYRRYLKSCGISFGVC